MAHLRQVLQEQVGAFIRKGRDGPWSSPLAQADLQQDIDRDVSVLAVPPRCRRGVRGYRAWEVAHARGRYPGAVLRRAST